MQEREITEQEAEKYLNTISNEIFDENVEDLTYKQRNTLRVNLMARNREGEIDDLSLNTMKKVFKEMKKDESQ